MLLLDAFLCGDRPSWFRPGLCESFWELRFDTRIRSVASALGSPFDLYQIGVDENLLKKHLMELFAKLPAAQIRSSLITS